MKNILPKRGFTLIELIVVMALLGILIVAGFGSYLGSIKRGRDAKRKGDIAGISKALQIYFNDAGGFPISTNGKIKGCTDATGSLVVDGCAWGGVFSNQQTQQVYMGTLPKDPVATNNYYYYAPGSGRYFYILAHLENKEDTAIPLNGTQQQYYSAVDGNSLTTSSCGGTCNYLVVSQNIEPVVTTANDN